MGVLERVRGCVGTPRLIAQTEKEACVTGSWFKTEKVGEEVSQMCEQETDQAWAVGPGESLLFVLRVMGKPPKGFKKGRDTVRSLMAKSHHTGLREERGMEGDLVSARMIKETGQMPR